jgi:RNA polymerase sigma-70 factor, ECF subfamily
MRDGRLRRRSTGRRTARWATEGGAVAMTTGRSGLWAPPGAGGVLSETRRVGDGTDSATRPGMGDADRREEAEGELAEVDQLHARYFDLVFAYVSLRVPSRAEAEDITAEVFVAAVIALPKFRGDSRPAAWLLGIARRKIAEAACRRGRRRERLDAELTEAERDSLGLLLASDLGELPEEAVLNEEARRVMRHLVAALPEPQREALLLQVVHDLSIREIAQVLGRSPAATNSLLQRARATLSRLGRSYFTG